MGSIDFPPLEPQESEEDNIISNSTAQIQNALKELGNILKDKNTESVEIKDIEPLPLNI